MIRRFLARFHRRADFLEAVEQMPPREIPPGLLGFRDGWQDTEENRVKPYTADDFNNDVYWRGYATGIAAFRAQRERR